MRTAAMLYVLYSFDKPHITRGALPTERLKSQRNSSGKWHQDENLPSIPKAMILSTVPKGSTGSLPGSIAFKPEGSLPKNQSEKTLQSYVKPQKKKDFTLSIPGRETVSTEQGYWVKPYPITGRLRRIYPKSPIPDNESKKSTIFSKTGLCLKPVLRKPYEVPTAVTTTDYTAEH